MSATRQAAAAEAVRASAETPPLHPEWDGRTGLSERNIPPSLRQIVVDNAELHEDVEVREAATAALAAGDAAIAAFLDTGLDQAERQAAQRKTETATRNRTAIEPLRGTGGQYLRAEVDRVLAGSDVDREQFLAYGKVIAEQRDAETSQSARDRAAENRAKVQMLTGAGGPEVRRAAQAALDAGDDAITAFLSSGYLVAAKADADERERLVKAEEDRRRAAEALSDLAKRAARANEARRVLMVAHGDGLRALQRSANALVAGGNEARKAAQILAANTAGG
ncbi:hypothetical protein CFP71_36825, partial [Amycolatopsis thailandensis]